MPALETQTLDSGYLCFDRTQAARTGARHAEAFLRATPFPHVVIDDFLDRAVLRRVVENTATR